MNRLWLWCTTAVIIAAGLYPPWTEKANIPYRLHFERSIGYSFLWSPPGSSVAKEYPGMTSVAVDGQRLLIEWFLIGLFAGVGMLASRRRPGGAMNGPLIPLQPIQLLGEIAQESPQTTGASGPRDRVPVVSPGGEPGTIPKSQLPDALKQGYRQPDKQGATSTEVSTAAPETAPGARTTPETPPSALAGKETAETPAPRAAQQAHERIGEIVPEVEAAERMDLSGGIIREREGSFAKRTPVELPELERIMEAIRLEKGIYSTSTPISERPDGPFKLKPWKLWAGLLLLIGIAYVARVYSEAEQVRAALEKNTPAVGPGMTVKEVGYVQRTETSLDFWEQRYHTWIQFGIPLSGDTWVCFWQSGNRLLSRDESVYFFHAADVSDEGSRDAVLLPILGENQPATACWVLTEDEAIDLSAQ